MTRNIPLRACKTSAIKGAAFLIFMLSAVAAKALNVPSEGFHNEPFEISVTSGNVNKTYVNVLEKYNSGTWGELGGTSGGSTFRTSLTRPVGQYKYKASYCTIFADQRGARTECNDGPIKTVQIGKRSNFDLFESGLLSASVDPSNDPNSGDTYLPPLPYETSVSSQGHFNISVPLELPPAMSDLAPQLAIQYSSGSNRNGLLGVGVDLAGVQSMIHRCPATVPQDGYVSGVSILDEYKMCLDGSRLVQVADNEYRTEHESLFGSMITAPIGRRSPTMAPKQLTTWQRKVEAASLMPGAGPLLKI